MKVINKLNNPKVIKVILFFWFLFLTILLSIHLFGFVFKDLLPNINVFILSIFLYIIGWNVLGRDRLNFVALYTVLCFAFFVLSFWIGYSGFSCIARVEVTCSSVCSKYSLSFIKNIYCYARFVIAIIFSLYSITGIWAISILSLFDIVGIKYKGFPFANKINQKIKIIYVMVIIFLPLIWLMISGSNILYKL